MRHSSGRRTLPVTVLLLLVGLVAGLGMATATRPAQAAGEGAVDAYGGCLVARKAGDLLIVIDESRSLEQNDPEQARISAARYLLSQLGGFATRAEVQLDVSIAGFSHTYAPAQGWTTLDEPGLASTLGTIDSFATRPFGFETDYWMALEGARRELAAKNPDGNRCQAMVWITDGSLDLDFRENAQERNEYGDTKPYLPDGTRLDNPGVERQAEEESTRQICRDGGLADQLRSSDVSLFGIGLRGQESPDYTLLRSISLGGTAGGMPCGRITEPPGSFTEVADIDDLLFEFDKFSNPTGEPNQQENGVCQGEVCEEARHSFVLDDSIQTVHVLANSEVPDAQVFLVDTAGNPVELPRAELGTAQQADIGDVGVSYTWQSENTVSIDMTAPAGTGGWAGQWAVAFVDPTSSSPDGLSRTSISIEGDVFPTWPDADSTTLRSGETTDITLGLVNGAGEVVDPGGLLGTVALDATLTADDGTTVTVAEQLDADELAESLSIELADLAPQDAELTLSLAITTAPATTPEGESVPGTALRPQSVVIPLRIAAPAGFPTLGQQVNFGAHEGRADNAPGSLTVTGPGCVWVTGGTPEIVAGPERLGEVTITSANNSPDTCLRVEEGQQAELPLALTTSDVDNGTLNANLTVSMAPLTAPERVQEVTVPATASFERPLNPVNFALTLIVAALLGPAIPLLLLYAMKWWTARIPGRALLAQEFGVTIAGGQVLRDGRPFALTPRDLTTQMVPLPARGARTAQAGSVQLQTRMGASPFGTGRVDVVAPGRIGGSSDDTRPHGKDHHARLPLNVHNHWVVLHDPQGPPDQATVLMLVGGDATTEVRQGLVDDVNNRGAEVVTGARAAVGAPTVDPGTAPFGGPDAGHAPGGGPNPFGAGAAFDQHPGPAPFGQHPGPGQYPGSEQAAGQGGPWGGGPTASAWGTPQQPAPPTAADVPAAGPTMPAQPADGSAWGHPMPVDEAAERTELRPPAGPGSASQPPAGPGSASQPPAGPGSASRPPAPQPSAPQPPDSRPQQDAPGPTDRGFRPAAPPPDTPQRNPFGGGHN